AGPSGVLCRLPALVSPGRRGPAGLLLAAGAGRRLGRGPKALLPHRGRTLVEHVAEAMLLGGCADVTVVCGAGAPDVAAALATRAGAGAWRTRGGRPAWARRCVVVSRRSAPAWTCWGWRWTGPGPAPRRSSVSSARTARAGSPRPHTAIATAGCSAGTPCSWTPAGPVRPLPPHTTTSGRGTCSRPAGTCCGRSEERRVGT